MNPLRKLVSPSRGRERSAAPENSSQAPHPHVNTLMPSIPENLVVESDDVSMVSFSGFSGIWWDGESTQEEMEAEAEDHEEGPSEEQRLDPRPRSYFSDSGSSSADTNSYFGPEESSIDLNGLVLAAVRLDDVYDRFLKDRSRYVPAQTPREKLQLDELDDRWWKELHAEAMEIAAKLERHEHDGRYDWILGVVERVHENQVGASLMLRAVFAYLKAVPPALEEDITADDPAGRRRQSVDRAGPSRIRQASVETIDRRGFPLQVGASFPAGEASPVELVDIDLERKANKALAAFENWHKSKSIFALVTRTSKKRKEDAKKLMPLQKELNNCALIIAQRQGYEAALNFARKATACQRNKRKPPTKMLKDWQIPSSLDEEFRLLLRGRMSLAYAKLVCDYCSPDSLDIPEACRYSAVVIETGRLAPVTQKHDRRTKRFPNGRQHRLWTLAKKDADRFAALVEEHCLMPETVVGLRDDEHQPLGRYIKTILMEHICATGVSSGPAPESVVKSLRSANSSNVVRDPVRAAKIAQELFEELQRSVVGRGTSIFPGVQDVRIPRSEVTSPPTGRPRARNALAIPVSPW